MSEREWNFDSGDIDKDFVELEEFFAAHPEVAAEVVRHPMIVNAVMDALPRLAVDPEVGEQVQALIRESGYGVVLLPGSEEISPDDPRLDG